VPRSLTTVLFAVVTLALGSEAQAQENKVGLNLAISQSPQIGLTILSSPKIAFRPSLSIQWTKFDAGLAGDVEATQIALTFDVLSTAVTRDRVTTYLGFGGTIGSISSDVLEDATIWAVRGLFGGRVRVFERLSVFGEVGIEYSDLGAGQNLALATFPIGVVLFLK
jgi:hypothetical protein